ncbi:hypothetical protein A3H80_01880 [Candidatus Roizmanbacteria bacterium RIFCSPLOWO2_02_FULL_37_19]|uniref:Uncharacterized protein n=1 Tax=Candidatus Roizmanbacteria bacterium RIFCSPHIGHO2_02_FULL_37_24 TaxID=1802037 RepID=A0A1F7GXJ9_9BACT|nr:MAG: hypothetical protein A2862_02530 [Candidatus Roizmanbacteria bacterium RIFCSPHIGHO2_01_FULL_38_41]OGK23524.1 MAG: hypothetical protein A3C24_01880 [Candidatus Roizmanbacteria bacterium RIFCSPHIGHO2_02_FULL_37_24]OGK31930.1 MAG: hypothetical protein A3E10_05350 [Candidatus Roizmanbacteria bacterium RIFCSPHIGHO2_12_FULL_37_23]OGK45414.1 MAG: hypothetical protein A2956_04815 [Candidatus Roizmanbacteria bacterium RIFCSPLOWO2_01_FULL_37_57]OGK54060.1 MAG: hypothetical protein A3H80_01880 [Ca
MNYTRKLIIYFIVNFVILYLAFLYGSDYIVFGRLEIGSLQAVLTSAFGIAIAIMLLDLIVYDFKIKIPAEKYILAEVLVNIGALYLLARTPLQNSVGVGIVAFWVAIVLGLILSLAQYGVKRMTDKK